MDIDGRIILYVLTLVSHPRSCSRVAKTVKGACSIIWWMSRVCTHMIGLQKRVGCQWLGDGCNVRKNKIQLNQYDKVSAEVLNKQ